MLTYCPYRITLVLGQTGLATARATSVVLSVRVSVQRHTNQELVRATIGALVLGCPPLGNSRTRSYHAIGRPVFGICALACKYF